VSTLQVNSKEYDASRCDIYKHINMGKDDFIANSFHGLFKNMLLCFVFGRKTSYLKRKAQLSLHSYSFVGRHYKRVSLYFKINMPSTPYIGKNIDFLDRLT
jgi:hypothetical protein